MNAIILGHCDSSRAVTSPTADCGQPELPLKRDFHSRCTYVFNLHAPLDSCCLVSPPQRHWWRRSAPCSCRGAPVAARTVSRNLTVAPLPSAKHSTHLFPLPGTMYRHLAQPPCVVRSRRTEHNIMREIMFAHLHQSAGGFSPS